MQTISTNGDHESEIHDLLRNDRRRQVIKQLQETGGVADLRTLARRIAEDETGESPPPKNIRKSVYNSLHQSHLPKLDRWDVVEYDSRRKTVRLDAGARSLNRHMEITTRYGFTWGEYYRSVATVGALTVLGAELGAPALSAIGSLLLSALLLAVIAVSTVYQLWSNRWLYLGRVR